MLTKSTEPSVSTDTSRKWHWLLVLGLSAGLLASGCGSEASPGDGDDEDAQDDANDDDSADDLDDEPADEGDGDEGDEDEGDGDSAGKLDAGPSKPMTDPKDAASGTGSTKDTGTSSGGNKDAGKDAASGTGSANDGGADTNKDASTGAGPGSSSGGSASCSSLPAPSDYGAKGPFSDAKMFSNVGPNNNYTLFRPTTSLGKDGFKHPIVTWGNGIVTTPGLYEELLTTIASHGFVVIGSNDTMAERPALNAGLDWLIAQNGTGEMAGKLDTETELAIGYSWGGGAAIDTSNRPNIVATVSFHGMPPRLGSAFKDMHAPLLLFTSTGDTFVSASGYVTPNYNKSTVQTFYATLEDSSADHLYVLGGAGLERGPAIAWMRFWACGDENARKFFYGDDCTLCQEPWAKPQRKNWP